MGRRVDGEPSERLPIEIVQRAWPGFAGELMHRDEAAVALPLRGEVVCVPAVGGSAEEELKARRGNGVL
jgi:hypothetical protein